MGIPEYLYFIGLSAKKAYSLRNQKKLPCRVISIGNLTVGGTGKTPATIALAEEAKRRGLFPVVLTRGYKGSAKGPCFVTRGEGALLGVDEAGDEPALMAGKLSGVPIVKGGNRYEAGLFALQHLNSQPPTPNSGLLFILDDGFQHWKLYRDKDILLIDSGDPFGNRTLLPLGKLREPVSAIKRADIVVLTKCAGPDRSQGKEVEGLIDEIKKYNTRAPIFLSGHSIVNARLRDGEKTVPDMIKGRKVFWFCGLGDPGAFRNTVVSSGALITGGRTFRDHYSYSAEDLAKIKTEAGKSGAEWIVTSEKDLVKIRDLDLPENIIIIGIEFSAGRKFYDAAFAF
jgi:tetraacyldisaccharide 4'-kinase